MKLGSTQLTEEQTDNFQRACRGKRFAIVAARFHNDIAEKLVDGARRALLACGVGEDAIDVYDVPGAFELPLAARTLILRREHRDTRFANRNSRFPGKFSKAQPARVYAGVVALGAVIRGETPHFDFVAGECARGIMSVQLETGSPIGFGVLTTDTLEQAERRASSEGGDKGYESALAVASLLALRYSEAIKHAKTHALNGVATNLELSDEEELSNDSEDARSESDETRNEPEETRNELDADPVSSRAELAAGERSRGIDESSSDVTDAEPVSSEPRVLEDRTLVCKDCSKEFIFAVDEQQFFVDKGFQNDPQRCRECRQSRRTTARSNQHQETVVCADCGITTTVPFRPREDRPVYCRACYANHSPENTTSEPTVA